MAKDYGRVRPPGKDNDNDPPETKPVTGGYERVAPPKKVDLPETQEPQEPAEPVAPQYEHEHQEAYGTGKKFPCKECGAAMQYTPGQSKLVCRYCGHEQAMEQELHQVEELSYDEYFEHGDVVEEVIEGAELETRCDGCGAQVNMPSHVKSDFCPFCGSQLTNPIVKATPVMAPSGVLPFKIDRKASTNAFHDWVKSRWFAPNALKEVDKLNKLEGVYLPYWTYDSKTFSQYRGQRGVHYYVTVGSGKNRRRERRTRWYNVGGRVNHFFDDVTVCASKSIPEDTIKKLEPWDTVAVQPFHKDYLSGFKTERYQISASQGFAKARDKMHERITELVKRDIGGDEQRIHSLETQHEDIK